MKYISKDYNSQETLLVITSYPNPNSGKHGKRDFNAIGEHSERRLPYLAQIGKVFVLAEKSGKRASFLAQKNLFVQRVWKKGNPFSILSLAKTAWRYNRVQTVLLQFEFNVFGGNIPNLALLPLLVLLRLMGKRVTFEMHQVITDIGKLEKHVQIKSKVKQRLYNLALVIFYSAVGILANNIIVFEEELKVRLQKFVSPKKIHVLPLSVDTKQALPKAKAKKLLGISKETFVILQFGFINGYKGLDFIIPATSGIEKKRMKLLIAGGKNPYLQHKPSYQKFYQSIVEKAQKAPHVIYANFVPDEKVSLYFSAADLVVLPYEVFMAASGPFSRTLAYQKPVLLSHNLLDYAKSNDFQKAIQEAQLTKEDLFFPLERRALLQKLYKTKTDKTYYTRLTKFSQSLGELRSCEEIAKQTYLLLFPTPQFSVVGRQSVAIASE